MKRASHSLIVLLTLALITLSLPAEALRQLHDANTWFGARDQTEQHPRRHQAAILVSADVSEQVLITIQYSRSVERFQNRGKLFIDLEILRDTDGDGELDSTEELRLEGRVESRRFRASVGPLAPLKEGDMILASVRFRKMPRIEAGRNVNFRLSLSGD